MRSATGSHRAAVPGGEPRGDWRREGPHNDELAMARRRPTAKMAHRSGEQLIHTVLVVNQDQIGWRNLSLAFFLQEFGYNARP